MAASVDGDSIIKHFLTGSSLRRYALCAMRIFLLLVHDTGRVFSRRVFAHLCNHASGQVTDPISDVVHTMLTCPVQMVISEVCALPFLHMQFGKSG